MTAVESLVWDALRGRKVGGLKFRRQAPIGPYIADFYCPAIRLVVEIDGPHHDLQVEEDAARTRLLESRACRVIRFRADDERLLLEHVEKAILEIAGLHVPTLPSPRSGEGDGREAGRVIDERTSL
jgi:very-short-patch-repair endonuclease